MAKGDAAKAQQTIDTQGGRAQAQLDKSGNAIQGQNQVFGNAYNQAAPKQMADYGNIMGNYNNIQSGIAGKYAPIQSGYQNFANGGGNVGLSNTGDVGAAISGFKNFADTGGFSQGDIQDIRARAVSPTRSIYSSAQADLARQKSLTGGYSPNSAAASSQMARNMSQQISDADIGANSNIAQMQQQGKLYGLTGLSDSALREQSNQLQASSLNNQSRLAGLSGWANAVGGETQGELGAAGGMRDLYGTSPGLMGTTGNQLLGSTGQMLQQGQEQNNLGLGLIGGQINKSQIPSNFQQALGNISGTLGLVGDVASLGTIPAMGNALQSKSVMPGTY